MEVKTARNPSVFHRKNQVCRFWLQGRCNRNPCRFMHTEVPTEQPSFAAPRPRRSKKLDHVDPLEKALADSRKKNKKLDQSTLEEKALTDSRKSSITEQVSKKGHVDTLEKALADSRKRSLTEKVSKNKKLDHVDLQSTLETDSRKSSITHAQLKVEKSSQPLQCKNWVTGNCVHGDKCKYLHSWFCGSGFTMLAKLEGHTEAVTGISLPSGSNKLYSVGKDRTVRVWDCSSGQCTDSAVTDCEVGCLVSEGPWLFLGLQDGSILVWKQHPETKIHEPAAMVREHNGSVCSLVIGANRLFSGSKDCTIKVWDLQNMQCLHTLTGHTNAVKSVLCWFCYLLSASLDNTLKGVHTLCGIHDAEARPILLCSFGDNTVRLYDLPTFTERGRIFSKGEVEVIKIGIEGLIFIGDATG